MDDRVPELVWVALLNQVFGFREGAALAASIAKAAAQCDQTTEKAFGCSQRLRGVE